jgi:hypothetical protein
MKTPDQRRFIAPRADSYSDRHITKGGLLVAALVVGLFFGGGYMQDYFVINNPPWPDPAAGRTYPMTFDHGLHQVYLSRTELRAYNAIWFGGVSVAGTALFFVIRQHRRRLQKGRSRDLEG